MADLTFSFFIASFIAGIISFLSPCVLPLIPGFLAYVSGTTLDEAKNQRLKVFMHSVAYVAGFAIVFSVLGVLLNTLLSSVAYSVQLWLSRIGGIIIILFGLYLVGLLKFSFLYREYKPSVTMSRFTYVNSFLFGAAFAVGWSPCVGAVLGSILALAISNPGSSFVLLFAYTLGLGLPFLLVGFFSDYALRFIRKLGPYLKYFNIIVGILLIVLGILVFTQTLSIVANFGLLNEVLL